jgi:hypothetical protein
MGKGKIALFDTNVYLGEEGVFEASEILRTMGIPIFSPTVYAAHMLEQLLIKLLQKHFWL